MHHVSAATILQILEILRPTHPRLLALPEDIKRATQLIETNTRAQDLYARLLQRGEAMLGRPPAESSPQAGDAADRVTEQPGSALLDRVYTLAVLHRLEDDPRWADRTVEELMASAALHDWNPTHWLDVAPRLHALAIGYDWLYDVLDDSERGAIKTAIVEKGLHEAARAFLEQAWWARTASSWNNVCNSAIIVGSLAVADEEPELASWLIVEALQNLAHALQAYAPDGGWAQGPDDWSLATFYTTAAMAALRSTVGTNFGLSREPGLKETGFFRLHIAGPSGRFFNFADTPEDSSLEPTLFWLARQYDDALLAHGARESDRLGRRHDTAGAEARGLLWFDPRLADSSPHQLTLDARYLRAHVACLRSSWSDINALYVGFKGGDNGAGHAHLDLGTLVLDARGQRWICDLGPDDPPLTSPGGEQRGDSYRQRTTGHNTITLDGADQDPRAVAPLVAFHSTPDAAHAIADLTAAYTAAGATRVWRGVALCDGRRSVLVQDEIDTARPVQIVCALHTRADVAVDGARAMLSLGGETLQLTILQPEGARLAIEDVRLDPPQWPLAGVRKLSVRLPEQVSTARVAVLLSPGGPAGQAPEIIPLGEWAKVLEAPAG